jgi:ABC-type dipeptide/oligopeptide/nickel transport system permease component
MFISFRKIRVPEDNLRRAGWALIFAVIALVVSGVAHVGRWMALEYYSFQTFLCALFGYLVLAVPYMMLAVTLLLSPMVTFLWFDSPSCRMTHQWWFWLHVLLAIAGGAWCLSVAGQKYPKRNEFE